MLDGVSDWSDAFNNLPKVADDSWMDNLANAVDGLTSGKLEISNIKTTPASFVFGKAAFKAGLAACVPTTDKTAAATNFATAWESGILASTMTVSVGASIGTPATPTNTYGSLNAAGSPFSPQTVIDPPSVTTAKSALVTAISGITPSETADDFAEAFRNAFLGLTCTTTGFDSTPYAPPSTVPIPLPNIAAPVA